MLLWFILIAWLAAIVMALALCRMAARADAAEMPGADARTRARRVPFEDPFAPIASSAALPAARAQLTAHGTRRRRAPNTTGS